MVLMLMLWSGFTVCLAAVFAATSALELAGDRESFE